MNDYGAADMRYGDLSETQLKKGFYLAEVSERVNPYTLTRRSSLDRPQSRFCCNLRGPGETLSRQQCANILFDEFRDNALPFALWGPYKYLIREMIDHMQYGNGTPFRSMLLDQALKEQILGDKADDASLKKIKKVLRDNIDWQHNYFPIVQKEAFYEELKSCRLPKFDRLQDMFNGMGITVHDTWATQITLRALTIENGQYRAQLHYKVQDHFGLDNHDIMKKTFHQFRFFRIWFLLQRYNQFGFKPFFTNMEAAVNITGDKDDNENR
ncbi:DUF3289 family protein [Paramixta manurensis]|uniref:DUF3289 family protein n=1 Tax=Paramixta manurensis TaxID=2740817 RepID=A0A6M8U6F1_9GAMM|nr:DUF3289 family protein [Erwiniaceae bacterium PD-1]